MSVAAAFVVCCIRVAVAQLSWGLRFASEFWYEPTPTTMVAGDVSLSSAATNHTLRLAYGWRMLDQFYVGPEAQYFGAEGYRHVRIGGHFTALKTDANEWLAAGGWARDSDGRSSAYVRLGMTMRRRGGPHIGPIVLRFDDRHIAAHLSERPHA